MLIVAPVEVRVDDRGLHRVGCGIERVHVVRVVRAAEPVRVQAFITVDVAFDRFGVRIQ